MRPSSLTTRLLISAGAWSVVVIVATGLILSSLYRDAVERAFDERLEVFVKGLIAEISFADDGSLHVNRALPEPRFSFPLSGWYWQIDPTASSTVGSISSPSLLDQMLDFSVMPALMPSDAIYQEVPAAFYIIGPGGEELRAIRRPIKFQSNEELLIFTVAGNANNIAEAERSFNSTLILALSILGLGLVFAAFLQVRYGLRPVRELRDALQEIRVGTERRITGKYPSEIAPLSNEVNALLDANEEVIERARTHVGNLAHALKTPLSVLSNEVQATKGTLKDKLEEQLLLMRRHIDHYLERARVAASANIIGVSTEVEPVIAGIVRTLKKIHGHRMIEVKVECRSDIRFIGEKQDLEEMVGNLLDNAFKWTNGKIKLSVVLDDAKISQGKQMVSIEIEDNGPGITEEQCAEVMKRGSRLDESKPGSGLGLSIVADIAAIYRGSFVLNRAELGGLSAKLVLPAHTREKCV